MPGIEVAGRVRAIGGGVQGFRVGEPVAALLNDFGRTQRVGGYAEVAVAHHSMATPVPESTDQRRLAAALSNGVAGWLALHHLARISADDRVLVLGASGGLGATTSRLASLHPVAQVIGVVSRDPSRGPRECSAVIEAGELSERLDELTADGTVDVVVDPVGGSQRVAAFRRLAPFGRHLILGNASGDDRPFSGDELWLSTRSVSGLSVGGIADTSPRLLASALAAIVSLVTDGSLREPEPAVARLDQVQAVHQAIAARRAPAKTVLAV